MSNGRERRIEERLDFEAPCTVSVVEPPWAITPSPLVARTANITIHGMRIDGLPAAAGRARQWEIALGEDSEIVVEVMMPAHLPLPIRGQVVWVDRRNEVGGEFSIGVLFSILPAPVNESLRQLLARL
jgi:hypothetical protein